MSAQLEQRVFTDPNMLTYLRMTAEDAEQDARLAEQARVRHFERPKALLEDERNFTVEGLERALVRDAALLFSRVVKAADPQVFTDELSKVLTEAEVDSMVHALSVAQSVHDSEV